MIGKGLPEASLPSELSGSRVVGYSYLRITFRLPIKPSGADKPVTRPSFKQW